MRQASSGKAMSDILFGVLLIGPLVVPSVFAVCGLQGGSYLRSATKSEVIFLAPRSIVVFPITLFAWIFWWCASPISVHLLLSGWRNVLSDPQATEWLTGSGLFLAGLYWAVLRWYGSICPLVLNLDRKTYRAFNANSAILKTHTGSWEDIAGVYVHRASAKGNVTYYVRLKWQGPQKLAGVLGGFSKQDKAEAFAAKMSKELGLPLVPAPSSWR